MKYKTYTWLKWIFSVMVTSTLPIIIRFIMFFGQRVQDILYPYTTIDIISLALFLLIAISYQILLDPIYEKEDKYVFISISLVFIVLIVLFYTQTLSDKSYDRWLIPNLIVLLGVFVYNILHVRYISLRSN